MPSELGVEGLADLILWQGENLFDKVGGHSLATEPTEIAAVFFAAFVFRVLPGKVAEIQFLPSKFAMQVIDQGFLLLAVFFDGADENVAGADHFGNVETAGIFKFAIFFEPVASLLFGDLGGRADSFFQPQLLRHVLLYELAELLFVQLLGGHALLHVFWVGKLAFEFSQAPFYCFGISLELFGFGVLPHQFVVDQLLHHCPASDAQVGLAHGVSVLAPAVKVNPGAEIELLTSERVSIDVCHPAIFFDRLS